MMRLLLPILLLVISFPGISQLNYYRVTLQPGFDYSYQLTAFRNGIPADFLGNLGRHHFGMQVSANVFISEKIGINFKGLAASKIYSGSRTKDEQELQTFLSNYHGPQYYVDEKNKIRTFSAGELSFLSLGGVYRIIKARWNYQFGFNVGVMQMQTADIFYYLKEHGSDSYQSVNLETDMEKRWMLFFEPSVLVSFSLHKRLGLFAAGSYSLSPAKIRQSEFKKDLYTDESLRTEYVTEKILQVLSLKLGLSIGIGKIIDKQAAGE